LSLLQNSNAISSGGYNLESSLRLRESASAYLSRTPTSTGDRQKFTVSAWVKFSKLDSSIILNSIASTGNRVVFRFSGTNGNFHVIISEGGINYGVLSNNYMRDPSAWYHLVLAVDTTQATSTNRIKGYINGEEITSWSSYNPPAQNYNMHINYSSATMAIGADTNASNYLSDAYYSEYNYVDGQTLTANDFGETDTTTGVWKPKQYTGTYGTNGFYLPMKETQQATGFNTITYKAINDNQSFTGVGFSPDLVWIKSRDNSTGHQLFDTVRGALKRISSNNTSAEDTPAGSLTSFDADGFSIGNAASVNGTGTSPFVAWCWDAGSSTVSNTDGSITTSVRANPTSGFSIVTYTGTGSALTIGHGLGVAPKMAIYKNRTSATTGGWIVNHTSLGISYLKLQSTDAASSFLATGWNPTSTTISLGSSASVNSNGDNYVAYVFTEVEGFSKIGSYTGNGSATPDAGNTVNCGFRPAFILFKNADDSRQWGIVDTTRSPSSPTNATLEPSTSNAENPYDDFNITDTGFSPATSDPGSNGNGHNIIYMAFADTRDAQFNFDASGNKNNWTDNNINSNASSEITYDIMNDVPTLTDEDTANFATLNPISPLATSTLQDGNLQMNSTSASWKHSYSTIALPNTGKWYFEMSQSSDNNNCHMGIAPVESLANGSNGYVTDAILTNTPNADGVAAGGLAGSTGTWTGTYNINAGDALACAVDMDANKVWFRIGSNWIQSGDPSTGTNPAVSGGINTSKTYHFIASAYAESVYANFGQRPFQYTVPTGFKKLNTYNLPDSTIADGSQYFDVVTYTGTDTDNHISIDFTPDFVWSKSRSDAQSNILYDSIRGNNKYLVTNSTNAEGTAASDAITFDSDGYTWYQNYSASNRSPYTYVNWAWRGSDSAPVTNTDGTITSTVSANTTSGFSIVTWTGDGGSNQSVGHGLGEQPDMVIIKKRNKSENWYVASTSSGYDTNLAYHLHLNTTGAVEGNNDPYYLNNIGSVTDRLLLANGTSNNGGNENGINYVAYCWHSVDGYSKIGSYTGNGSTDGPFVYTGFRPAFVLIKLTSASGGNWHILDTSRDTYNLMINNLYPNASNAESTSDHFRCDTVSNGFKLRTSNTQSNYSGQTFIYMAFAENPFKNSLAR